MALTHRAALDMLKKSMRQGGNRKLSSGKDMEGADAPEQLRKLQLQVSLETQTLAPFRALELPYAALGLSSKTCGQWFNPFFCPSFQVQQRDNEINILVSMLKKREAAMGLHLAPALQSGPALTPNPAAQPSTSTSYSPPTLISTPTHLTPPPPASGAEPHYGSATSSVAPLHQAPGLSSRQLQGQFPPDQPGSQGGSGGPAGGQPQQRGGAGDLLDTSVLADRGKAFDLFRWALQLLAGH